MALAAAALGVNAQQTKLLTADKMNEYGLVYTLPHTALKIEVEATHKVMKAGPYAQYAKKYLGTTNVVSEDAEQWTLNRVRVTPYGVPDRDNEYLMQLKPGALTYLCVADDGMLLGINKEVTLPKAEEWSPSAMTASTLTDNEYLQYVDADFLASQSSAKRAQMLAQALMEVRESKVALSRGTAETMPADGRQLELMLESLRHQEQSMTDAFTGTVQQETVVRTYTYMPQRGDKGRKVLFRLSDFAGFVAADDYSGDPVYIQADAVRLGELPVNEKGEEKVMPKDGVAYRIPGAAHVVLTHEGRTLFESDMDMAQYGVVFGLAPTLFSAKKDPSAATFNPATGALTELELME